MKKTTSHQPFLGITMGDPAGIGPEVIVKALSLPSITRVCRPLVIGSPEVLVKTAHHLHIHLKFHRVHSEAEIITGPIAVIDPLTRPLPPFSMGRISKETGMAQAQYIEAAVRLAIDRRIDAVVTAPINKAAINLAGYPYPGHTEMLAELTGAKEVGMMILGGPFRFMFTTTHVAIKDLATRLTADGVERAVRLCHQGLTTLFGIKRPRIAVAALNPHAGEGGLFGKEEQEIIAPGIAQAQAQGYPASGPFPADTLIGQAARGKYDAVVAMYHDQGLIPLKLVAFGKSVNTTIGLPIIRTSVDHGTAYDIAGKGLADEGSLLEAMRLAAEFARRQRS